MTIRQPYLLTETGRLLSGRRFGLAPAGQYGSLQIWNGGVGDEQLVINELIVGTSSGDQIIAARYDVALPSVTADIAAHKTGTSSVGEIRGRSSATSLLASVPLTPFLDLHILAGDLKILNFHEDPIILENNEGLVFENISVAQQMSIQAFWAEE